MSATQNNKTGANVSDALEIMHKAASAVGADAFDIVARHSSSLGLSAFQGKIQQTEISESVGIGIRIFRNGAPGYASTERLTSESLQQTLQDALSHCLFTEPLHLTLPGPCVLPEEPSHWNPALESLGLEEMARFALDVEARAFALSSEIENIPHLGYGVSQDQSWFANSSGIRHYDRENSFGVGLGAVALRNGVRKMGVYQRSGRDLAQANAEHIASMAVARSLELLDAKPMAGGSIPAIISNRVTGSLIGMFLSSFHSESVQKGQSRLAGKLGQKIAAKCFRLSSEPFRWDLPGASVMDSEGVPTQPFTLIEDGLLRGFIHNLETAKREGCTSTGHASRAYSGRVGTSFHNCVVAPGTQNDADLMRLFPRCLEVVKLEGSSGCSAVSGEISIGVQGFLWENGERVQAVDGVTISTNFFDLLQQIVTVGSEYNDSYSSVKIPSFALESVAVSG